MTAILKNVKKLPDGGFFVVVTTLVSRPQSRDPLFREHGPRISSAALSDVRTCAWAFPGALRSIRGTPSAVASRPFSGQNGANVPNKRRRNHGGTIITFKRPDGKDASGYLANAARGDAPGVVVIQEWWGLQDQIKGMCDRFARAGFDALAPDLYKGKVVPYHDTDAAGKEMNSLDFMDATTQTVRGAAQYLARNGAKVGLTGFCLGGAVTIIGATKIPELTAGVVFYGIPPDGTVSVRVNAGRPSRHCAHGRCGSTTSSMPSSRNRSEPRKSSRLGAICCGSIRTPRCVAGRSRCSRRADRPTVPPSLPVTETC